MNKTLKLVVDGAEMDVDGNMTILQACEQAGAEIPRFCYHERLSIAGNCRMCLVEVAGMPKPVASCAMQIKDLRPGRNGEPPEVKTFSPLVKKAREGVMEFLLINHPLDCPICDQGGECDLQDQAMAYGEAGSRYHEPKRAHDEINLGPLVKTAMTRCIHCTRCVRFTTEVCGVTEMGSTGRGEDAEIISYLDQALTSELSGNVVDLCPVGALTSRPYAFAARPWELRKTETIDAMDALGSNIRADVRGRAVLRVLPRNHDDVNEEWISDKTRYAIDGLGRQRLDRPYIRHEGKLRPATWDEAFAHIVAKLHGLKGEEIAAVAGDLVSVEAMYSLKDLLGRLGSTRVECRQEGAALPPENRAAWLFNPGIAGIDRADAILIIGSNPRKEAAVLNARLRRAWLNGAEIATIGPDADLTYPVTRLGAGPETLADAANLDWVRETLAKAKNPLIILGNGAVSRADGAAVLSAAMGLAESLGAIREDWTGFALLHQAASRVGGLEIGFASEGGIAKIYDDAASGALKAVWLLGADEIDPSRLGSAFVVYQGHHGDKGAHRADVILPTGAWLEQPGLYVNMEGRPQLALTAALPPGEAREDWAALRALSAALGVAQPFDDLGGLRKALFAEFPRLAAVDSREAAVWSGVPASEGGLSGAPFAESVPDYFMTNAVARASATMAELSKLAKERRGTTLAAAE
ncbi:NADH-quinone oxidoreductase subunit NuoG [Neomegalonema perideroedes]|uniref:NADH-quinone oxidoreductase subunit NuoG n=1 Tax=Neomegalonema perideroedes TaxID=217219 RepID=UPI000361808A|nr:NADH-quinone oxidoreductase subunit NuoG [Neomegalonema perideroedes]